jgi:hypothetical protein
MAKAPSKRCSSQRSTTGSDGALHFLRQHDVDEPAGDGGAEQARALERRVGLAERREERSATAPPPRARVQRVGGDGPAPVRSHASKNCCSTSWMNRPRRRGDGAD